MQVQKIIHLTDEEVHTLLQKFVASKVGGIVEKVIKTAEGYEAHVAKTVLEEVKKVASEAETVVKNTKEKI